MKHRILVTNDDGIRSPGLWAAVEAFAGFAEILVVAPREQQFALAMEVRQHLSIGELSKQFAPFFRKNAVAVSLPGRIV